MPDEAQQQAPIPHDPGALMETLFTYWGWQVVDVPIPAGPGRPPTMQKALKFANRDGTVVHTYLLGPKTAKDMSRELASPPPPTAGEMAVLGDLRSPGV